jgi:hypothetical protein
MTYTFIARRCEDLPVATCCRVMGVSTSGFYAWRANPVTGRDWADAVLTNTIVDIHRMSGAAMAARGCTPSCDWARASGAAVNGWSG